MTVVEINAAENVTAVISSLCNTTQSHITLAVVDKRIICGAIGPEFFKLYDTGCRADENNLAVRIPAKVMKTVCTSPCTIHIEIDTTIKILRLIDGGVIMGVTIPLEQDFNLNLIENVLADVAVATEPFDISAIGELRSLIAYADSGLQCKDGLAYVIGSGFTVYRTVANKLSFIMTKENISEFVSFSNAYGDIELFESSIYTVFFSHGHYFGCKQPRSFVESDYSAYVASKPLYSVPINFIELRSVMKAVGIPKGTSPKCEFDMERFVVRMDLGIYGRYAIAVGVPGAEAVQGKSSHFSVSAESLKHVLSSSSSKADAATLTVYKPFISLKIGDNDFLLVRE